MTKEETTITIEVQVDEIDFYKVPPQERSRWDIKERGTEIDKTLLTLTQELDINHSPLSFEEWAVNGIEYLLDDIKKIFGKRVIYNRYY